VTKRAELRGVISTKPGSTRQRRTTAAGCCAAVTPPVHRGHRAELQATAAGRTRLARHERVVYLRPVYHRKEDRIRAHMLLCWLALLLTRTIEDGRPRVGDERRQRSSKR
jgi:hypothetical protein